MPHRSRNPAGPAWQVSAVLAGLPAGKLVTAADALVTVSVHRGRQTDIPRSSAQKFARLPKRIAHQAEDPQAGRRFAGAVGCGRQHDS